MMRAVFRPWSFRHVRSAHILAVPPNDHPASPVVRGSACAVGSYPCRAGPFFGHLGGWIGHGPLDTQRRSVGLTGREALFVVAVVFCGGGLFSHRDGGVRSERTHGAV